MSFKFSKFNWFGVSCVLKMSPIKSKKKCHFFFYPHQTKKWLKGFYSNFPPKFTFLPRPSMENFSPKGSLFGKLPELMKTEGHKRSLCVVPTIVVTGAHIVWEEGPHSITPPFKSYHQYGWDLDLKWSPNKKHLLYEYNLGSDIISSGFTQLWLMLG